MRDLGFCCEPAYVEKTTIQTVDERNTGVRKKTVPIGQSNGDKEEVEDHRSQNTAMINSNQNVEWVGHPAIDNHIGSLWCPLVTENIARRNVFEG